MCNFKQGNIYSHKLMLGLFEFVKFHPKFQDEGVFRSVDDGYINDYLLENMEHHFQYGQKVICSHSKDFKKECKAIFLVDASESFNRPVFLVNYENTPMAFQYIKPIGDL